MHSRLSRSLVFAGFMAFSAASIACGGTKKPAEAPKTETAAAPRSGSMAPDPQATEANKEQAAPPATPTAATSSTDNGSDIVPPFTSSAAPAEPPAKKKAGKSGGSKKSGGRARKKG